MFCKAVRIVSFSSPTQVLVTAVMLAWSGTIPNKQFEIGELISEAKRIQQHRLFHGLFCASSSQCLELFPKVFTRLRHSLYVSAWEDGFEKIRGGVWG